MSTLTPPRPRTTATSSTTYLTPARRYPSSSSPSQAGAVAGIARATTVLGGSPAYGTNARKHSLYGREDWLVIDPGSRIWKAGFSGESQPRKVFYTSPSPSSTSSSDSIDSIWELDHEQMLHRYRKGKHKEDSWIEQEMESGDDVDMDIQRETMIGGMSKEDWKELDVILKSRIKRTLRDVFFKQLLADPKARRVTILESPLLPTKIKEIMIEIMLENLKVPSVNFTPTGVSALMAMGKTTGLVVDIGWLETTVLPIFAHRPLYPNLISTPTASSAFSQRLSLLIRKFARYIPEAVMERPVMPTRKGKRSPAEAKAMDVESDRNESMEADATERVEKTRLVPSELLTQEVLEDIRIKACYIYHEQPLSPSIASSHLVSTGTTEEDISSHFLSNLYSHLSPLIPDYRFAVPPHLTITGPSKGKQSVKPAKIVIPGWIRIAVGELFFEETDGDECSVVEAILRCLIKLPVDLRSPLISNILLIGGGGMLRGFLPRLKNELIKALENSFPLEEEEITVLPGELPAKPTDQNSQRNKTTKSLPTKYEKSVIRSEVNARRKRHTTPWIDLVGLIDKVEILNEGGPRWSSHLLPWVGGSIAGALQVGGKEISREAFDLLYLESKKEKAVESFGPVPLNHLIEDWSQAVKAEA